MKNQEKTANTFKNNSFDSFGLQTELINYFSSPWKLSELKNTYALQDLQDRYEAIDHPAAMKIYKLLSATIIFLSKTNPEFREINDKSISETFNAMAQAFTEASANAQQENLDADARKTISDAIDYCLQSVKNHLMHLKEISNRAYVIYEREDNDLKEFYKKYSLKTAK